LKVLFAAAEGVPFAKTGGLADVIGALPKYLVKQGVETAVFLPLYSDVPEMYKQQMELVYRFSVHLGWRNQYCGILKLEHQGVDFYFVDNEGYFKRPGTYGFFDDGERYAFFCRAVLECLPAVGLKPDIIHCHDWHTGMIPVMLKQYRNQPFYDWIKTVFTIHNLQYQGVFSKSMLGDVLDIGWEHFHPDGIEFHDQVSFMKGGLNYSDWITTVSPTYAQEIQDPFYGANLEGVLRRRQGQLSGILNGLDYEEWDPHTDPYLKENYTFRSIKRKMRNKQHLQERLGLPEDGSVPLLAMVTRLASQKGLDLVARVMEEILRTGVQFVVLGTGEAQYEDFFRRYGERYPEQVSANIMFNNELAHQVYAAADLFLMPSLFEPCGLSQLIALRYGALPIVRETGGLKDTVVAYNEATGEGNGFSFANYNAHDMLYTIERAVSFYHDRADGVWDMLVKRAMKADFSWDKSAEEYIRLYEQVLAKEVRT